jgi:hypothetical protein
MRKSLILFALLLIALPAFSITIEQTPNQNPPITQNTQDNTQLQLINQRLTNLENKMTAAPDIPYLDSKMNQFASFVATQLRDIKDFLCLIIIFAGLFNLAIWFGFFFYLKSIGRM